MGCVGGVDFSGRAPSGGEAVEDGSKESVASVCGPVLDGVVVDIEGGRKAFSSDGEVVAEEGEPSGGDSVVVFEGGGNTVCCAPVCVPEEEEGDFGLEGAGGEVGVKVGVRVETGV